MTNISYKTKMLAIAAAILVFSATAQAQSLDPPTVCIDGQTVHESYLYPEGTSSAGMLESVTTGYGKVDFSHTSETARIYYKWITANQCTYADSVPVFMTGYGGFMPRATQYIGTDPPIAPLGYSYLKFVVLDNQSGWSFQERSQVFQVTIYRERPQLNISSHNSEQGTVSGDQGAHDVGTSVQVEATPNSGYLFSHWSDNNPADTIFSYDAQLSFVLERTTYLEAYFKHDTIVFQTDGSWDDPNNWNIGRLPTPFEDVVISAAAFVPNGVRAEVTNIQIKDGGSLTIKDGGQLYHANADVVATVEKVIAPYTVGQSYGDNLADGWRFVAHPMSAAVDVANATNLASICDYDLYAFDQSQEMEWRNYKKGGGFDLEPGKGYLYALQDNGTVSITGTLNPVNTEINSQTIANTIFVDLDYDGSASLAGWNLVGNPFPFPAYASKSHYTMNADGTAIEPHAVSSATPIPVCSGAMVKAEGENETVGFTIVPDAWQTATQQGNIQIAVAQANQRGASAGSASVLDKAIVSFDAGDALEKFVFNRENAQIYIPQGGRDFAIAYMGSRDAACHVSTDEIPVNFKAAKNGEYTLTFDLENVELNYLHLIDNLTGADVDLLATSTGSVATYTFTAKTTDYASRFRLVFSADEDVCEPGGNFAYVHNGEIVINDADACVASLQVVDVMGRVIASYGGHTRCVPTQGMTAGVYVLRLIGGDSVRTQKIVID